MFLGAEGWESRCSRFIGYVWKVQEDRGLSNWGMAGEKGDRSYTGVLNSLLAGCSSGNVRWNCSM